MNLLHLSSICMLDKHILGRIPYCLTAELMYALLSYVDLYSCLIILLNFSEISLDFRCVTDTIKMKQRESDKVEAV